MDITQMLAELRAQHQQLDEAILALQRLATRRWRQTHRPPAEVDGNNSRAGRSSRIDCAQAHAQALQRSDAQAYGRCAAEEMG